jgi:hypothetical protein
MIPAFEYAILNCSDAILDALWAILKYKEISIMRKINAMSEILDVDSNSIMEYAVFSDDGRVLNKETRHVIHSLLINRTKQ